MVGAGVLLATPPPGEPATTSIAVRLVSTDAPLPLGTPAPWWLSAGTNNLFGSASSPTPHALAAAQSQPMIGPGGLLIGNGLDAPADCTSTACNGGAGANGGSGGNAGRLFGIGGKGGDGITGADGTLAAPNGAAGGSGAGGKGADGKSGQQGSGGSSGTTGTGGGGGKGGAGGSGGPA